MKFLTRIIRGLFGLSKSASSDTETETQGSEITVERESSDAETTTTETEVVEEEPEPDVEIEEPSEPQATDETEPQDTDRVVEDTEEAEPVESAADGASASTEEINGIGSTYSERLAAAGIETVGALAENDPETVAEAAEASESRAEEWIDQARNW